jgi:beta-galactosidase
MMMSPSRILAFGLLLGGFGLNASAQTIANVVPDGRPHRFETRDHQFFLDGQPTMLVTGEMHFGRVLPEDWDQRIKQAKAMGLNAVSFYLFWNQVEPKEGQFSFSGITDVRRVLQLCRDNGMWAILRPGPYCCAEEEYGGIPYWTLRYPNVKVRSNDAQYVEWSRRYIAQVYKQVADLQVTHGGPLLMVQVENEYGIIARGNIDYMRSLTQIFHDVGFDVPLFTCDPTTPVWRDASLRVPGLMYCRNGLKDDRGYAQSAAGIGDNPVYVPEVYTAWFSGWGEKIAHRFPLPQGLKWANYLLDHQYSFCLYLEFGGTNFGFSNGCNMYLPVQTSYDYEAPIDEAGRTTEKYRAFRDLFSKRFGRHLPDPPPEPSVIELPTVTLDQKEPLLAMLPAAPTLVSAKPVAMEDLDQAYGFVLYRKQFPQGIKGTLELKQAMDYTIVMVNGKTVGKAFRGDGLDSNKIPLDQAGPATLDLLVYNLGRISVPVSSATQSIAHKGLIGGAALDGQDLSDWQIYSLPFDHIDHFQASAAPHTGPTIYRGTFTTGRPGGTFLDMRKWSMGAVWVNGHNLGRFWDRGGLRSLWVPGQWLNAGQNEIYVLELHDAPSAPEVSGGLNVIEEPAKPFSVRLDGSAAPPPSNT